MRSGTAWGSGHEYARKYVCVLCGRELTAVEGDVSGTALYQDCDRVRWRRISVVDGVWALAEGTTLRTVNGNLYTVFPSRRLCVEDETRKPLPIELVPLPVWAMDHRRA